MVADVAGRPDDVCYWWQSEHPDCARRDAGREGRVVSAGAGGARHVPLAAAPRHRSPDARLTRERNLCLLGRRGKKASRNVASGLRHDLDLHTCRFYIISIYFFADAAIEPALRGNAMDFIATETGSFGAILIALRDCTMRVRN